MSPHHIEIGKSKITWQDLEKVMRGKNVKLSLSDGAIAAISRCRKILDEKIASGATIYGVNTGFGYLANKTIASSDLSKLQVNLIRSHACGTGEILSDELVRLMMFSKINSLSLGYSGVHQSTVQAIIDLFNAGAIPKVWSQGSLGASGDLSPLAHLSLTLIGEGELKYQGKWQPTAEVLKQLDLRPIDLDAKEGLALLNGTQFMLAHGVYAMIQGRRLANWANALAALSIDAFDARIDPFHPGLHTVRSHKGQGHVSALVRKWLEGSEIIQNTDKQIQDPYSFRCVPQVHGASFDVLDHAAQVFLTEANSVSDNPTILPDENLVLSGGNFHGQPLAYQLDFMSIALAEIGSISERRTFQLMSGQRGLPLFLVGEPGLRSGLMISQYSAAALVSENKQLCTPASLDSITSSNGQEDHVSMGANGAVKAIRVLNNLAHILGVELMSVSQALSFRSKSTSPALTSVLESFRKLVPVVEDDRELSIDIRNSGKFLLENAPEIV